MITLLIVLTGIMAGIYFAFSVFIMKSLAELPAIHAAQAMNKINTVILKSLFLPIFVGTTVAYVGLLVWSLLNWQGEPSLWVVIAAIAYVFGMFVVTVVGNVPLNNQLQQSADSESKLIETWQLYLKQWTRFNHIRTISCIGAGFSLNISQLF